MSGWKFEVLPLCQPKPDGEPIDIDAIQKLCARGLDECAPEDRVVAWLVLSGVLPRQPEEWTAFKAEKMAEYADFVDLVKIRDHENHIYPNSSDNVTFDLPDQYLMELIHGDVVRTQHHVVFLPHPDTEIENDESKMMPFHNQMRRIERILYVFAKMNPTLSYMQGFNEICTVLFFAYSSALTYFNNDMDEVETFVFFTFQQIFACTQLQELFTTQDRSSLIHGRLRVFMSVLRVHVPGACEIIEGHEIHPLCFCFRWLNLLFAQDYLMPDLVRIWDSLFSHFKQFIDYANYVAVAQVKMMEHNLDEEDYIKTIHTLQKSQILDIKGLLTYANTFWNEDHTPKPQKKSFWSRKKK